VCITIYHHETSLKLRETSLLMRETSLMLREYWILSPDMHYRRLTWPDPALLTITRSFGGGLGKGNIPRPMQLVLSDPSSEW
jgi:hypothetical protein